MAISTIGSTNGPWSVSNSTINDIYDGQRYYSEQERRYREDMERQRYAAMQNTAYNAYGDTSAKQMEEAPKSKKAAQPEYLNNNKLLLLEN